MPRLQTVLLDPAGRDQATVLEVLEGVCRVYCPCEETEGMTLAFLQSGDRLRVLFPTGVIVSKESPNLHPMALTLAIGR